MRFLLAYIVTIIMEKKDVWSTAHIIKNRNSWSLASDAELLKHLQSLSQKLIEKSQSALGSLSAFENGVNNTCIAIANANNRFKSLSDTQFIESKVQDDVETVEPAATVEEEKTPEGYDITAKLKNALDNGIQVLRTQYDIIAVTDSDSEDEGTQEVLLKSRNPYMNRRLPFIIGTDDFTKYDHLGLVSSSDDEDEEDDAESEDDIENLTQYTKSNITIPKPQQLPVEETSKPRTQIIRISSDSESSADEDSKPVEVPCKLPEMPTLQDHLDATLKNISNCTIPPYIDDIFSPPPFPTRSTNDLTGNEDSDSETSDIFSSTKNISKLPESRIFIQSKSSSDDESSSHDKLPRHPPRKSSRQNHKSPIVHSRESSITSDISSDNVPPIKNMQPSTNPPISSKQVVDLPNKHLFNAMNQELNAKLKKNMPVNVIESHDDDSTISKALSSDKNSKKRVPKQKSASNDVNSVSDKLFQTPTVQSDIQTKTDSNLESSKVKIPTKFKTAAANLFEDDDSMDELFKSKNESPDVNLATEAAKKNFNRGLFDNSDEDIFAEGSEDKEKEKKSNDPVPNSRNNASSLLSKKLDLFDDDSDSGDDIFALINNQKKKLAKSEKITPASTVEDFFSSQSSKCPKEKLKSDLFNVDDSDDSITNSIIKPSTRKNVHHDDIFSPIEKTVPSKVEMTNEKSISKLLFEGCDENVSTFTAKNESKGLSNSVIKELKTEIADRNKTKVIFEDVGNKIPPFVTKGERTKSENVKKSKVGVLFDDIEKPSSFTAENKSKLSSDSFNKILKGEKEENKSENVEKSNVGILFDDNKKLSSFIDENKSKQLSDSSNVILKGKKEENKPENDGVFEDAIEDTSHFVIKDKKQLFPRPVMKELKFENQKKFNIGALFEDAELPSFAAENESKTFDNEHKSENEKNDATLKQKSTLFATDHIFSEEFKAKSMKSDMFVLSDDDSPSETGIFGFVSKQPEAKMTPSIPKRLIPHFESQFSEVQKQHEKLPSRTVISSVQECEGITGEVSGKACILPPVLKKMATDESDTLSSNTVIPPVSAPAAGKLIAGKGLNINVNALLPGTNWSTISKQVKSWELSVPPFEKSVESQITKTTTTKIEEDSSDTLPIIIKNRVKVKPLRRPLSRRARISKVSNSDIFSTVTNASDDEPDSSYKTASESNSLSTNNSDVKDSEIKKDTFSDLNKLPPSIISKEDVRPLLDDSFDDFKPHALLPCLSKDRVKKSLVSKTIPKKSAPQVQISISSSLTDDQSSCKGVKKLEYETASHLGNDLLAASGTREPPALKDSDFKNLLDDSDDDDIFIDALTKDDTDESDNIQKEGIPSSTNTEPEKKNITEFHSIVPPSESNSISTSPKKSIIANQHTSDLFSFPDNKKDEILLPAPADMKIENEPKIPVDISAISKTEIMKDAAVLKEQMCNLLAAAGDDDDELDFLKSSAVPRVLQQTKPESASYESYDTKKVTTVLSKTFDSEFDDELDDIFSKVSKPKDITPAVTQKPESIIKENVLLEDKISRNVESKTALKKLNLFSHTDSVDLFSEPSSKFKNTTNVEKSSQVVQTSTLNSSTKETEKPLKSIDDDILLSAALNESIKKQSDLKFKCSSNIFADDDDDDLFVSRKMPLLKNKLAAKSLFDDSDDYDLFGSKVSSRPSKSDEPVKKPVQPNTLEKTRVVKRRSEAVVIDPITGEHIKK